MNNKNLILTLFLIIIPLVLLILWYRNYVYNYCQNDMKCLKEKLIFNLDNINNKLEMESFKIKKQIEEEEQEKEQEEEELKKNIDEEVVVEGFFGGLSSWFSGSSPSELNVNPGTLPNESLSILEKKISNKTIKSNKFPPEELDGSIDDFKDSDNSELLNFTQNKNDKKNIKPLVKPNNENKNNEAVFSNNNLNKNIPPASEGIIKLDNISKNVNKVDKKDFKEKPKLEIDTKKQDKKSLFGNCQFFNDKCPDNYSPLGNFSIQGVSSNSILTCGNVQNTKPARAIAEIKNNSVYEIHITDQGHGFNPSSVPKVSIESGKGHGATAEAVVDDDGFLKIIKVINPGYNYSETPRVIIDAPFMNSSCHLCCKNE